MMLEYVSKPSSTGLNQHNATMAKRLKLSYVHGLPQPIYQITRASRKIVILQQYIQAIIGYCLLVKRIYLK